jgi:serine/threonine protein kinase
LLERVGNGSMGVLYRGQDTLLGREVAVKVMAANLLGNASAHARFFREAKAAARLQHVNIVTVFEFGEHEGTPYIVTEFLRGASLARRLRQAPPLSLRDKLATAIQLCAGLEAAHGQGVVHRDIKPANIWICQDGTVKLLDVGLATATSSAASSSDVLGVLGYMSPEQVGDGDVDGRSDVFSVGVVMYEMLSGRHPFRAPSLAGVMQKIVHERAEPIVDAELPPALTSAVMRAMEKSPPARYARASELGRELKAIEAGLLVPSGPEAPLTEQTALHIPPPTAATVEGGGATLLETVLGSRVGRLSFLLVLFLIALVAGVLAWYL